MSSKSEGNALLDAIRSLLVSTLKTIGLLCAWCLKLIGSSILYISSLLFKLAAK